MNLQIINVSGIDGYEKDGVVYLKLETVARGLGFVDTKDGVEYVRWARVDKYLAELNFATCGERPEYIPENVFYRLAMKAKNEAAEAFQAKIADEVIPSIRKTGGYQAKPMTAAQMFAMQAQINLEQEQRLALMEKKTDYLSDSVKQLCKPVISNDTWQHEMLRRVRSLCEEYDLNYQQFITDLYKELEESAGVNLETRQKRKRERLELQGAKYAERQAVSKLSIIADDRKLREILSGIVQNHAAALVVSKMPMA